MDHRYKCNKQKYETARREQREKIQMTLGVGNDFLDTAPKVWSMTEIINKLDLIKMKNSHSAKDGQEN